MKIISRRLKTLCAVARTARKATIPAEYLRARGRHLLGYLANLLHQPVLARKHAEFIRALQSRSFSSRFLCKLHDGQRGACFVRKREGAQMILTTYGRSSGFCIDPIEKKPLAHFYPGSSVFSFGTVGCNLACKFCQNWDIRKSRDTNRLMDQAAPEEIAKAAQQHGCKSEAFTYNDPVIFAEYAMDTADACHKRGIKTVAVTAGYMHDQARREFYAKMDAVNVDLKAFIEDFYFKITGAHLQPVLDTLIYLKRETQVWLEITTLLIPGKNDSDGEITALSQWIVNELGARCAVALLCLSPGLQNAGCAGHATCNA